MSITTERLTSVRYVTAILVAILAAFVLARAFPARAHGLYSWINDGNYKAADGSHCCGLADCLEVKPGDIAEAPGNISTPYGLVDRRAVY